MKTPPLPSGKKGDLPNQPQPWYKILPNQATWVRWQAIAHRVGDVQARLLLTLLYALFIAPIGLCWRWVEDPLGLHQSPQVDGYWQKRNHKQSNLRQAGRQG